MGKTIGHAVLWPAPPAAPYRAGSPSHSSQPGSEKSLVVTVVVAEKNSCSQARSRASKHSAQLRREKNSSQLTEDLAQGHSQDSTWPGTGPPPARITLRKGGGAAGAGPGAAGARLGPSAHGKECSFLRRPAQRVPPAAPWHGRVQPRGGWGMLSRGGSPTPLPNHQSSLSFCAQKGPKETRVCASLEVSIYLSYPRN